MKCFHSDGLKKGSTFYIEIPIYQYKNAETFVQFNSSIIRSGLRGHAAILPELPTTTNTLDNVVMINSTEHDLEAASESVALRILIVDDSSANRFV